MRANPELRRHLWMDFTLTRIILTITIVSIIAYTSHLTGGTSALRSTSYALACFFIFLWGIKDASETVIDEINAKTWDFQRQTAISAWSMTWGKWMGCTLFSWSAAGLCLIYFIASVSSNEWNSDIVRIIVTLILGGLLGQAVALLSSLQIASSLRRESTHKTFRYFMMGLFVSIIFMIPATSAIHSNLSISWFHFSFADKNFILLSLLLFTGWAIVGLYRSFCTELQYQTLPAFWIAFNLFCMIYFSGLSTAIADNALFGMTIGYKESPLWDEISGLLRKAPYYTAFFVVSILTYIALFSEVLSAVNYKKLYLRFKEDSFSKAFVQVPLWALSFLGMVITCIMTLFEIIPITKSMSSTFSPSTFLITSLMLTFRDVLLIHYLNFSASIKRVLGAILVYLVLLYCLIPSLLAALHQTALVDVFLPSWGKNTSVAITGISIQIALFGYLCWVNAKRAWKHLD